MAHRQDELGEQPCCMFADDGDAENPSNVQRQGVYRKECALEMGAGRTPVNLTAGLFARGVVE
jgi:hypothetical protein